MPYYGPKQVKCPKCNKIHTIMYGDVIGPDFAYMCICTSCRPSCSKVISSLYDWLFGQESNDADRSPKQKSDKE